MNHQIEFKAMGCKMVAIVESEAEPELLQQVPLWFEAWEQCLSRFRPNSELNRLNQSAGWPFEVSETLWQVFQVAMDAEKRSGGLVTPTVLQALIAAGYDRSFERMPRQLESAPGEGMPRLLSGWPTAGTLAEVSWDAVTRSICLPADVQLDFGGVAKGWAADQAAKGLAAAGPALVSAGGDIAISAEPSTGSLWPVGVDDPFHPGELLEVLMVGRGGIATSGTDYRRWRQGGRWNHHIIDPRTGQPAQTEVFAATVVAPNAMDAEVAAKVALLLGAQRGIEWLDARPNLAGMLVLENGDQVITQRMEALFWRQS